MRKEVRLFVVVALLAAAICLLTDGPAFAGRRGARRTSTRPVAKPVEQRPIETPAAPSLPKPTIDPRQAMADILSLRQAQSTGDPVADEAFATALQKMIEQQHGGANEPSLADPARAVREVPGTAATTPGIVLTLRDAARHYDDRANELESQKLYAEADAARQMASQLRGEARRLDP